MFLAPKMTKVSTIVDKHLQKIIDIKEQSRKDKNKRHESAMRRLDTLNDILQKIIEKEGKK